MEEENHADDEFVMPSGFVYPPGLVLPRSQKAFELIVHTAKKTRVNQQLEILIKVKQEFNIAFDFLNHDSPLHGFYEFVKSLPEDKFWSILLGRGVITSRDALTQLGENYLSSDEETTAEDAAATAKTDRLRRAQALQRYFLEKIEQEKSSQEDTIISTIPTDAAIEKVVSINIQSLRGKIKARVYDLLDL